MVDATRSTLTYVTSPDPVLLAAKMERIRELRRDRAAEVFAEHNGMIEVGIGETHSYGWVVHSGVSVVND